MIGREWVCRMSGYWVKMCGLFMDAYETLQNGNQRTRLMFINEG